MERLDGVGWRGLRTLRVSGGVEFFTQRIGHRRSPVPFARSAKWVRHPTVGADTCGNGGVVVPASASSFEWSNSKAGQGYATRPTGQGIKGPVQDSGFDQAQQVNDLDISSAAAAPLGPVSSRILHEPRNFAKHSVRYHGGTGAEILQGVLRDMHNSFRFFGLSGPESGIVHCL